jgi:hypothetical protein
MPFIYSPPAADSIRLVEARGKRSAAIEGENAKQHSPTNIQRQLSTREPKIEIPPTAFVLKRNRSLVDLLRLFDLF